MKPKNSKHPITNSEADYLEPSPLRSLDACGSLELLNSSFVGESSLVEFLLFYACAKVQTLCGNFRGINAPTSHLFHVSLKVFVYLLAQRKRKDSTKASTPLNKRGVSAYFFFTA